MNQWQRCKRNPQPTSTFHQILPNQYKAKQNLDRWGKNNTFKITLESGLKIKIRFYLWIRYLILLSLFFFFFTLQGVLFSWGPLWDGHVKKKECSRGTQREEEKMRAAYIFAEGVPSPAALPNLPAAEPCSRQQDHAFGRSWRLELSRCDICLVLWKL